jgi:hypothetical protein
LLKRLVPIRNSRINQIHEGGIRYSDKKKRIKGRWRWTGPLSRGRVSVVV